jgi:hypothetical protein
MALQIPPNLPLQKGGENRVPPFDKGGRGGILVRWQPLLRKTMDPCIIRH